MKLRDLLAVWIIICALFVGSAQAAEGEASIPGLIFISPSGELEGDLVMRGAGVEVMLVRAEDGFDTEIELIRKNRLSVIDKQLQAVSSAQADLLRSLNRPREEQQKKSANLRLQREKLEEVRAAYEKEIRALIAKHTLAKAKADPEGKFNLNGIPPGRYFLHAHFEILAMGIHYYWLVPVHLTGDKDVEVTLNKQNATTQL
jgi:hypothetical protein